MKNPALTILLLMATSALAFSNGLQEDISAINNQLRQIRTVKYTVDQRLSVRSGSIVSFDITTTDAKGNRSAESYILDLADIDPNTLSSGLQRNMMIVEVHTRNNERLIASVSQGEVKRYQTDIELDVEDNDHARSLIASLKNAAITAKNLEDARYNYSSLDEIRMDLATAMKPFSTVTEQKVTFDPQRKDKLNIHIQENNGVTKRYEFNLKDLDPTSLKVEAHGTSLSIPVNAYGGEKVMKLYENDLAKGFVQRFVIYAESVNAAKRIRRLLALAVDAANGKVAYSNSPKTVSKTTSAAPATQQRETKVSAPQDKGSFPKVELTKDAESGKYAWTGIYEMPGRSAEELYRALEAAIPPKQVIAKTDQQIVFQRMGGNGTAMRLGGDAFLSFTIKVGVKDGKVRLEETDFSYDNRAWGFSAPQTLETMNAKKLNKIVGDINELLTKGNSNFMKGAMEKIRLTEQEDW